MLEKLRYLTAGESHGKGLLGIIDGIPANLKISEDYIKFQLSRRQKGHGRSNRMKIESDFAELYCGVRQGKTNGGPIGLIISNKDHKNWLECMSRVCYFHQFFFGYESKADDSRNIVSHRSLEIFPSFYRYDLK